MQDSKTPGPTRRPVSVKTVHQDPEPGPDLGLGTSETPTRAFPILKGGNHRKQHNSPIFTRDRLAEADEPTKPFRGRAKERS
jgi:hypothetical protein